jgi:hypothetical protein
MRVSIRESREAAHISRVENILDAADEIAKEINR